MPLTTSPARVVLAVLVFALFGRLDAAEVERREYGFLTSVSRIPATLLRPGSMIVAQPEIPMAILSLAVPVPIMGDAA